MDAVVSITHEVGAEVDIKDISIAHHLPGRRKPIIVKSARKKRKKELISLLNNKQATWTNSEIRAIFFFNLLKKLLTTMT